MTLPLHPGKAFFPGILCALIFLSTSCAQYRKSVYFADDQATEGKAYAMKRGEEYRLKQGDNLFIRILGWEEKTYDFFNPGPGSLNESGFQESYFYFNGYIIDPMGMIRMPVLGEVRMEGLTLAEATDSLQVRVDRYLKDSRVILRLAGFRVTVLGEVKTPAQITLYDHGTSLFDVLSMCGDITGFGNRERVQLIRTSGDTVRTHYLDLTRSDILSSELLTVRPDDIIYVEPRRLRFWTWNAAQAGGTLSLVLSVITLVSVLNMR